MEPINYNSKLPIQMSDEYWEMRVSIFILFLFILYFIWYFYFILIFILFFIKHAAGHYYDDPLQEKWDVQVYFITLFIYLFIYLFF